MYRIFLLIRNGIYSYLLKYDAKQFLLSSLSACVSAWTCMLNKLQNTEFC